MDSDDQNKKSKIDVVIDKSIKIYIIGSVIITIILLTLRVFKIINWPLTRIFSPIWASMVGFMCLMFLIFVIALFFVLYKYIEIKIKLFFKKEEHKANSDIDDAEDFENRY